MIESPSARILLVEDDPYSRDMLHRRLESRGFVVRTCDHGEQCLESISADPPDLVLLDVNLPGISGLEAVRAIRSTHSHDTLPVILVTALGDSEDVIAGLEAGANDYVVKPVNLPVLLARMRVCLRIRQSVSLLVEAERDRVMLRTLGRACEQIAQPMTAVTMLLEMLVRHPPTDAGELRSELSQILAVTTEAGEIIHRLRAIAVSRAMPYTERIKILEGKFASPE